MNEKEKAESEKKESFPFPGGAEEDEKNWKLDFSSKKKEEAVEVLLPVISKVKAGGGGG